MMVRVHTEISLGLRSLGSGPGSLDHITATSHVIIRRPLSSCSQTRAYWQDGALKENSPLDQSVDYSFCGHVFNTMHQRQKGG